MRLSISTKLFISFALVLGLSLGPAYWYVKRHLMDRVFAAVESELHEHVDRVALRLQRVPDAELDPTARDVAEILVDRVSVIGLDGRVLGESAVPHEGLTQMENHLGRPEVQEALRSGYGKAMRQSSTKGEPYLYVARRFYDTKGKVRGVVRLSRPLGVIHLSFGQAVTFLNRTAGVAGSLMLLLSLSISIFVVRPLRVLQQAAQGYARGEYTHRLPASTHDEISDLAEAMSALARRVQTEMVTHSSADALRAGLVRAVPAPLLVLGPDLMPQELNAPLREALGIDPANEQARIHELCQAPEFTAALSAAEATGQPQPMKVRLPWRRGRQQLVLWPLPAAQGRTAWAVVGHEGRGERNGRAAEKAQARAAELLEALRGHCPQPEAQAVLAELHAAQDAMVPPGMPAPDAVAPLDLQQALQRVLDEVGPLAAARVAELVAEGAQVDVQVADAEGRVERVLRAALVRVLLSAPAEAVVSLMVHVKPKVVQIEISAPQDLRAVPVMDLDGLLAPLGGSAGPPRDPSSAAVLVEGTAAGAGAVAEPGESGPAGPSIDAGAGAELWLQLRRA